MEQQTAQAPELFYRDGRPFSGLTPANYDARKGTASFMRPTKCGRCGGAGGSQAWAHTGWTCYQCGGHGQGAPVLTKIYTRERLDKLVASKAKRDARAEEKRAAEQAARDAERLAALAGNRAAFDAEYPGFAGLLDMYADNEFFQSLRTQLEERGTLTAAQVEAAHASIQRERANQQRAARAHYIGTPGERIELMIKVERIIELNSRFGPCYLFACVTPDGAPVVYIGSSRAMPKEGETARIKAGIKEHKEYKGLPQTVIDRPKRVDE